MTKEVSPDKMKAVLEEIAYGDPWGGRVEYHLGYMQEIAAKVLEDNVTPCVLGTEDEIAATKKRFANK